MSHPRRDVEFIDHQLDNSEPSSGPSAASFSNVDDPIFSVPGRSRISTTPIQISSPPVTPKPSFSIGNLPGMLTLTPRPSMSRLLKNSPIEQLTDIIPLVQSKESDVFGGGSLPPSSAPHSPASESSNYDFSGLSASVKFENTSDLDHDLKFGLFTSQDFYASDSESDSECEFEVSEDECTGQLIEWLPGSTWDTYVYGRHSDDSLPWRLITVENSKWIRIQSKKCTVYIKDSQEHNLRACSACQSLINSKALNHFMDQAAQDSKPHTPLKYLSSSQICKRYIVLQKKVNEMKLKVSE